VKVLLISTYELGHQPLGVASPARALLDAGHEVMALDTSVDPYREELCEWADAVAISVPMHTAMRLGLSLARRIKRENPGLPVAFYGLYAAIGADRTVGSVIDRAIVGEYEARLVGWVEDLARGERLVGVERDLGRSSFGLPARHLLPPLDRYAHLQVDGEHRLVGYTEASHGCRHRCRHCPVPVVYDGTFRITGIDSVLADVEQLAAAGARHITFGDPDFLNGPAYAMRVIEAVHSEFPDLTNDLTIKVSHILEAPERLERLAASGTLFIVSAFETVSDGVLRLLDKGHTVTEMSRAVAECRRFGIDIHPSWMPFTPWTTPDEILGIFRFLSDHDLFEVTDPVQLSIRLLIPEGSLLTAIPEIAPHLGSYDGDALSYQWSSSDARMDVLAKDLAAIAASGADAGDDPMSTMLEMWETAQSRTGGQIAEAQLPIGATSGRPRLTEPWFC